MAEGEGGRGKDSINTYFFFFPSPPPPPSISMDRGWCLAVDADPFFPRTPYRTGELDFFSGDGVVKRETSLPSTEPPPSDPGVNTGLHLLTMNTGGDTRMGEHPEKETKRASEELAMLQVELEEMKTENRRLKEMLEEASDNYTALQFQLFSLRHSPQADQRSEEGEEEKTKGQLYSFMEIMQGCGGGKLEGGEEEEEEERCGSSSNERTRSSSPHNSGDSTPQKQGREREVGMQMETTTETEAFVPNKVPKLSFPKPFDQAADSNMRKARVCVRARSESPMIADGCQWRKYGQKMAKGNPCPRAYYRCTMAVACPVRKQVQRCAEDRSILITSYEGGHNHPLPPAAVAMASTTAAAASMLLSGSIPSTDGYMNHNLLARAILPSSSTSIATISASAPFPTVTLDLTTTQNHGLLPMQQFQRPPPSTPLPQQQQPHFPPLSFGLPSPSYQNHSKFSGLHTSSPSSPSPSPINALHSPRFEHPFFSPPNHHTHNLHHTHHPLLADTLTAATAAIATDPTFTAALAAAISSFIGFGGGGGAHDHDGAAPTPEATTVPSNCQQQHLHQKNQFEKC